MRAVIWKKLRKRVRHSKAPRVMVVEITGTSALSRLFEWNLLLKMWYLHILIYEED